MPSLHRIQPLCELTEMWNRFTPLDIAFQVDVSVSPFLEYNNRPSLALELREHRVSHWAVHQPPRIKSDSKLVGAHAHKFSLHAVLFKSSDVVQTAQTMTQHKLRHYQSAERLESGSANIFFGRLHAEGMKIAASTSSISACLGD